MSKHLVILHTFFGKLALRLKNEIVRDVPPEYALCEFECRKTQCQFNDWLHCANRLSYLALEERLAACIPTEVDAGSVTARAGLGVGRNSS
jgi:hypothetical protein